MVRNPAPSPTAVLRGHLSPVNSLCFVHDHAIVPRHDAPSLSAAAPQGLVSGSADGTLKVWDMTTRREVCSVQAHSKAGILQTATHGAAILSQGRDGLVKWWDAVDGGELREFRTLAIGSYTFTKAHVVDANLVLVPTEHAETVALFDVRTPGNQPAMEFHGASLKSGMCMALTSLPVSSGVMACVGFEGGVVALYDLRQGLTPVVAPAVSPSTGMLPRVVSDPAKASLRIVLCMEPVYGSATLLCGTSGEEHVAVTLTAATDADTATFYRTKQPGISAVANRTFDDRIFATAGWDHRVRVFHRSFKPLATLKYHTDSVYAVQFSRDGKWLASASKDHKIALWCVYPPSST
ncbi:hypothetical protein, variant 1 [Aphanomyces invadans]|uniref:Guanine nucleotide-binding protein subunit beta-like protein n=1 Tax=Aphanomyces invadans TaxID=157072 RepID=A0A024UNW8_9STRA|nr:hypothetical protein, variant 1 [Aphanomyces invadans]ETW07537.1 hypothetical protein, variant 1 [Aphanomyces invadans]|eukprot:XP_008863631.1 hypothetical protein, variant 1 [Aphanomyces invadans]